MKRLQNGGQKTLLGSFKVPCTRCPHPAADLVVKSLDGVLFKVHKGLLIAGSSVFRNMFLHPQPPVLEKLSDEQIDWPEPATTITAVLYQLYPIVKPKTITVDELITVAIAADKWEMDGLMATIQAEILKPEHFDQRPFAIYKLACRLDDAELKRASSQRLVESCDPLDGGLDGDLDGLSARDFVFLCRLRKDRVKYCLEQVTNCLPPTCLCEWAVSYGSWKTLLEQELAVRPAWTSVPYPMYMLSTLKLCTFQCGDELNHSGWVENVVQELRENLKDRSRFT